MIDICPADDFDEANTFGIQNTRVQKQDSAARFFRFELGRSELHPTFAF
jgi:hypothetical protein